MRRVETGSPLQHLKGNAINILLKDIHAYKLSIKQTPCFICLQQSVVYYNTTYQPLAITHLSIIHIKSYQYQVQQPTTYQ